MTVVLEERAIAQEFARPLRLTSPLTKGAAVKDAQYLMQGHSRFPDIQTYKDGKLDGIYGEDSAGATHRTKFWLGYPLSACDHTFGQTLYEYLRPNHWRPLPADYQRRRAERIAAAALTPGQKAFAEAVKHLGYTESPRNSNRTIFGEWYRMNGEPWCAIFGSYCFDKSGWTKFRYSYVPTIYQDARNGRNGLHLVSTPRHGDLALFDWLGEPLAHVSFYDAKIDGARFRDLGGNTGPVDLANGGEVARGVRHYNQVHAFVRVG